MKKYTSGSFTVTKYAIYKEDTDIITSFPATIYADGENASAKVYGNMQQTGTPTPTTPITTSECGDLETVGDKTGQYKIPIESANTLTTVFLGEMQTTRIIKKLVLDGTEDDWRTSGSGAGQIFNHTIGLSADSRPIAICNMFLQVNNATVNNNSFDIVSSSGSAVIRFNNSGIASTVSDWKTFLAAKYAANTPVTIWYVLAEPTTGTVNEPLRKINEYADTVTATIPTIAAADNINVTTTLKPSAIDLTYKGWHKYDDKKRSGGAWT